MRFLSFAGLLLTGCAFAPGSPTPQGILQRPGFAWEALEVPGWRVYLDTTTEPHLPKTRLPGILDSARIAVLIALGIPSLPETITVFVVPSRARMKALVGREVNGTAFSRTNTICVVLFPSGWVGVQHELLHIVAMQVWGVPDRWLNEGLAVAVNGNWHGYPLHALAHHLQTAGQLPSVEVLLHGFNQTDDLLTYPAAGSFVLFLLERSGRESLRRLWGGTDSWANIYAKSSTALEAEWLAVVKAAPSEGIVYPLTRTAGGTASNPRLE